MQPHQDPYKVFIKRNARKKPLKAKKWLFPINSERKYTRELYELTAKLRSLITEYLIPQLPQLIFRANIAAPEQPRTDDFLTDLLRTMGFIRTAIQPKIVETEADALGIARQINVFNKVQFAKVTDALLSIDVFFHEPWLEDQLALFASQNSELITSLVDDEIQRVSGIVQRGFQQGLPYKTVADQIQSSFGVSRRHAKLIARDQTVKLNASLTKLRQEDLGIEHYEWQTSGDERVRASHRMMDGLICRWDDPTVYRRPGEKKWRKRTSSMPKNHPGGDVQCRCVTIAQIEGFTDG
jgi:SPP1 gp7 family putative phage head morphogenesis protein